MGAAKKLLIILLIYFIAGFIVSYLFSAGMLNSLDSVTREYIALIFIPSVWIWNNLLAPLLGMPIAYDLPF